MARKKGPGIRCVNCGCHLDPGERCDCEKLEAQRRSAAKQAETRRIVEHNQCMMEQALVEFDYA